MEGACFCLFTLVCLHLRALIGSPSRLSLRALNLAQTSCSIVLCLITRMLAKARRKMEHYLRMAPGLALPASFLMGPLDTTFAGFGTFAAVWITSAQLPFHDAAQLSPSQSSRPSRQPRYAIKVLQVPIGNQKARFYPQGFNAHAAANG
eukprot:1159505-Pelagomonas_calceolata.AAC.2